MTALVQMSGSYFLPLLSQPSYQLVLCPQEIEVTISCWGQGTD